MATTTNFGWETPDDTDLVKDGAAAMRTLGNSIDTSFVDLKGGTTGQVLAKASNTDLDYTWVAQDDSNAIQNAIVDAKGDLISATGNDTPARLAVGTNGQVLTADATTSTGLKWATASAGTKNFSLLGTGTLTGAATITVSGISNQDEIWVIIKAASSVNANAGMLVRFNSDSTSNYIQYGTYISAGSTYNDGNFIGYNYTGTEITAAYMSNNAGSEVMGSLFITGAATSGKKMFQIMAGANESGGSGQQLTHAGGFWNNSSTITSISLVSSSGNFDNGTFDVYGSA
jgi:hypothetical protein